MKPDNTNYMLYWDTTSTFVEKYAIHNSGFAHKLERYLTKDRGLVSYTDKSSFEQYKSTDIDVFQSLTTDEAHELVQALMPLHKETEQDNVLISYATEQIADGIIHGGSLAEALQTGIKPVTIAQLATNHWQVDYFKHELINHVQTAVTYMGDRDG